jgi:hypothetical protein
MTYPMVDRRDEDGDRIAVIHSYAPGDGNLSFVAMDPHTKEAVGPSPNRKECAAVLPAGWDCMRMALTGAREKSLIVS